MKEEKKLLDNSKTDYKESNEENSKKYIIIVIFILLCACTYYYYYSFSKPAKEKETKKPDKQEKVVKKQSKKSQNDKKAKNGQKDKNNNNKINKKIQNKVKKQIIPKSKKVEVVEKKVKEPTSRYDIKKTEIKPFDKMLLANMAFNSIGKVNPFSLKKMYFKTKFDKELPNPPKISDNTSDVPKKKRKIIVLKGFMDDEVIVSIYGMVRSLKVNDAFRGFKALKIDSENLVAEFEKDGKIITRSLESLASITDSKEIRIID